MTTALPPSSDFTGAAITEGNFKSAMTNLRAFLAGLLGTSGEQSAALIAMGAPLNSGVSKSGAYTVVAADRGKVINCTGTWTLSVTAVATLGDGFQFAVFNSGVGTITIDPNLSEQIDGATTKTVAAGQLVLIYCDGTKLATAGGASGGLLGVTIHTANGTHITNALCKKLIVMGVGGGGAGGSGVISNNDGGFGGMAGAVNWAYTASPSSSYTVTIGAGGTGSAGNNGGDGSSTTFGALLIAAGGRGGVKFGLDKGTGDSAVSLPGGAGQSCLGAGGAIKTTSGAGNAASANTGAGGGGALGSAYAGGSGGSGFLMVWEFA